MRTDSASFLLNLIIEKTIGELAPKQQRLIDQLVASAPDPAKAARELKRVEVAAAALDFENFPVKAREILRDRLQKSENLMKSNREPTPDAFHDRDSGLDAQSAEMPIRLRETIIADGMAFVDKTYGSGKRNTPSRTGSELESTSSLGAMPDFADESYEEFRPRGVPVGRKNSLASMARSSAAQFGKLGRSVSRLPKVREVGTLAVAAAGLLALALFLRQQPEPIDIATAPEFASVMEEGPSLIWMDDKSVNRHHREEFLTNPPVDMTRVTSKIGSNRNAKGDWLWSDSQQKGFVTFSGLEVNDPERFQYQVWIFDKKVNQKYPVSGGVFNVVDKRQSVIVLLPQLRISKAVQFMVTQERPGGVDASSRDNIVTTATIAK